MRRMFPYVILIKLPPFFKIYDMTRFYKKMQEIARHPGRTRVRSFLVRRNQIKAFFFPILFW